MCSSGSARDGSAAAMLPARWGEMGDGSEEGRRSWAEEERRLRGDGVASASSPQISWASREKRARRPERAGKRREVAVGDATRLTAGEGMVNSSSRGCSSSSEEASSEESTKPRPGVRALGGTGGWDCSSERRHERARTPLRRITVPRATRQACSVDSRSICLK